MFGRYGLKAAQRGWYAVNETECAMEITSPTKTKVPPQYVSIKSAVLESETELLANCMHSTE